MKRNTTTVFSNAPARADGKQRACDRCDKINPEMGQMFRDESRGKGARRVHRCATDRAGKKCFQCDNRPNGDASGDSAFLGAHRDVENHKHQHRGENDLENQRLQRRTGRSGCSQGRMLREQRAQEQTRSAPDNWLST